MVAIKLDDQTEYCMADKLYHAVESAADRLLLRAMIRYMAELENEVLSLRQKVLLPVDASEVEVKSSQ